MEFQLLIYHYSQILLLWCRGQWDGIRLIIVMNTGAAMIRTCSTPAATYGTDTLDLSVNGNGHKADGPRSFGVICEDLHSTRHHIC